MYRHWGSVQAVQPIGGVEVQLYSFMTTALEGGEVSASHPGCSLPPGKTRYPLYGRLGGPQGQSGQVRKISPLPGFDPQTVQPVASHYADWATRPIKRGCSCQTKLCSTLLDLITIKMLGKCKNYEALAYVIVSLLLLFHLSLVQTFPPTFRSRIFSIRVIPLSRKTCITLRQNNLLNFGYLHLNLTFMWLCIVTDFLKYEGNSISKLQIQVATYVFELSAGNCHC